MAIDYDKEISEGYVAFSKFTGNADTISDALAMLGYRQTAPVVIGTASYVNFADPEHPQTIRQIHSVLNPDPLGEDEIPSLERGFCVVHVDENQPNQGDVQFRVTFE